MADYDVTREHDGRLKAVIDGPIPLCAWCLEPASDRQHAKMPDGVCPSYTHLSGPISEAWREQGRREVMAQWAAHKERNLLALTPQGIADDMDTTALALVQYGQAMGRREVLREIAALTNEDPLDMPWVVQQDNMGGIMICRLCLCEFGTPHKPTCLWLRAQAVK